MREEVSITVTYGYWMSGGPDDLVPHWEGSGGGDPRSVTIVSGEFLADDTSVGATRDTGLKLLTVTQKWLDGPNEKQLSLTVLRTDD